MNTSLKLNLTAESDVVNDILVLRIYMDDADSNYGYVFKRQTNRIDNVSDIILDDLPDAEIDKYGPYIVKSGDYGYKSIAYVDASIYISTIGDLEQVLKKFLDLKYKVYFFFTADDSIVDESYSDLRTYLSFKAKRLALELIGQTIGCANIDKIEYTDAIEDTDPDIDPDEDIYEYGIVEDTSSSGIITKDMISVFSDNVKRLKSYKHIAVSAKYELSTVC